MGSVVNFHMSSGGVDVGILKDAGLVGAVCHVSRPCSMALLLVLETGNALLGGVVEEVVCGP